MSLTHTRIEVFLMLLGLKVVSSNSIHIVLLEVDYNFHLLKALTLCIKEKYIKCFYRISVQI